jgi:hypothetical protein
VLTRFAWPGYTLTLAEPRFCGVFSLLSAATSRTRGSANFQDYGIAGFPDHFLALVVRIGHSGASPHQSPTESASQARHRSTAARCCRMMEYANNKLK